MVLGLGLIKPWFKLFQCDNDPRRSYSPIFIVIMYFKLGKQVGFFFWNQWFTSNLATKLMPLLLIGVDIVVEYFPTQMIFIAIFSLTHYICIQLYLINLWRLPVFSLKWYPFCNWYTLIYLLLYEEELGKAPSLLLM